MKFSQEDFRRVFAKEALSQFRENGFAKCCPEQKISPAHLLFIIGRLGRVDSLALDKSNLADLQFRLMATLQKIAAKDYAEFRQSKSNVLNWFLEPDCEDSELSGDEMDEIENSLQGGVLEDKDNLERIFVVTLREQLMETLEQPDWQHFAEAVKSQLITLGTSTGLVSPEHSSQLEAEINARLGAAEPSTEAELTEKSGSKSALAPHPARK